MSCDNILTIAVSQLGRPVGYLYADQEPALTRALANAFALVPGATSWPG